jgi:hypothetical protein
MFGGTGGPFFSWGTPGATAQDLGIAAGQWYQSVSGTQNQGAPGVQTITPGIQNQGLAGLSQNGQTPSTPLVAQGGGGPVQQLFPPTPAAQATPNKGAVLAAIEGVILASTPAQKAHEFLWQPGKGVAGKDEFKEEVLAYHAEVKAYAVVQPKSTVVKVIHGLSKYFHPSAAQDLRGKVIARLGDWTEIATPYSVAMPDNTTWAWEKVKLCNDAVAWANFVGGAANKNEVWTPPATPQTTIDLPRMVYLPATLAKYAVEKERTAFEMYQHLSSLVSRDESGIDEASAKMLLQWFMAAGQKEHGTTTQQKLSVKFDIVASVEPEFVQWAHKQLCSYVGQGPVKLVQPQQTQPSHADAYLQSMTKVLTEFATSHKTALSEQAKKSEEGKTLNDYDVAALCGFCGVSDPGQCPAIYPMFKTSKNVEDARANIMKGMEMFSKEEGIEIDRSIFLSEEVIKDIMKVRPNPFGTVGTAETSDRGVTNLVLLPRRNEEIDKMMLQEKAVEESKHTRTLRDAERLAKNDTRAPPRNYYTLKLNVGSTVVFLGVVYGTKCSLYLKMKLFYNILNSREVYGLRDAYSQLKCRQYVWAIYDDMRSFFSQRMQPSDFQKMSPTYPVSLLDSIFEQARFALEVNRVNFPVAWLEKTEPEVKYTGNYESEGRGPMSFLSPYAAVNGDNNDTRRSQDLYCSSTGQTFEHMHPKLRAALKDFHKKFQGRTYLQEIMAQAGVSWSDMPKLRATTNRETGKDELCWNWLLGTCRFGSKCNFFRSHDNGKNLPDQFVEDVIRVLKPGIEK